MPENDNIEYIQLLVKTLSDNGIVVPEPPSVTSRKLAELARYAKDHPDHPYVY